MPRSGSTLFRLILGNGDGILSIPETHFLVFYNTHKKLSLDIEENRLQVINAWVNYWTVKKMFSDTASLKERLISEMFSFNSILIITIDCYIKDNSIASPRYVIEKSPPHIFFQNDINFLFPESSAIYLIRDPRAVIGSLLDKSWSTHNVYSLARSWKSSTRKFGWINDSIIVKYEDIASGDLEVYNKFKQCFNLSVSYEEFYSVESFGKQKGVLYQFQKELSKPLNTNNLEKWKNQLSVIDNERAIIEYVCEIQMKKFGYSIDKSRRGIRFYLNLLSLQISFLASRI